MKLIRCHVENFGCLNNFDYSFTDGLNILYQPNGFGKSTLAAFIKAMFYGLPKGGRGGLDKNERKKYYPWQGGRFGGFLEFMHEGTCYRVERFFGKSATGDTFLLYDMTRRKEQARFGRDLGDELFHLDADSFQRSTYMPQQRGTIDFSTGSILAKLSNLVEDTNDVNNYETAAQKLKSRRSYYQAYRGDGGRINELSGSIDNLRNELVKSASLKDELAETATRLAACEKRYAELCEKRAALQTRISAFSTLEAEREKHNTFMRLEEEKRTIQDQLKELDRQYPAGYPSAEEIETFDLDSAELKNEKKSPSSKAIPLLLGGAALLIVGILCLIFFVPLIGVILAAAGAVMLMKGQAQERKRQRDELLGEIRTLKMRIDKDERGRLREKLRQVQDELEEFLRKNPQAAKAPAWPQQEEIKSLDSLIVEREELDREVSKIELDQRPSLREQRYGLQQKLEELPRLQDRLDKQFDELSEAILARDRLDKALAYLEQAKTELSTGYVSRVETRFRTYAQKLIGDEIGKPALDHELDIRLEEGGETHELGYYSVGSIDSIMLCMHLALADTLFADEPSFIILDDPFVNLDDKRTTRALELLEELGNTRQILYLVCNSSRRKFLP